MSDSGINVPEAVRQLLSIVEQLCKSYPNKRFTLDGRLLGDLGEILVAESYDIRLHEGLAKHHDGQSSDGRSVQIKATMKDALTFPCDHVPDFYLGIKIFPDGSFEEVFNGPGKVVSDLLNNRQPSKTNLHSVSIKALKARQSQVAASERIPKRSSLVD